MTTALVPQSHARLSASSAHRWVHCAGSLLAEALFPDTSSAYADEGTDAHFTVARALEWNVSASEVNEHADTPEHGRRFGESDVEAMQLYLDFVRSLWTLCDETWIEHQEMIPESVVHLPEDVGGTSDAGGIDYGAETLHVSDLKFGRGVVVEIHGNAQLRIYALAKYGALPHDQRMRLRHVAMHIIQPRAEHRDGPIRTETIRVVELLQWARETVGPAAVAALRVGAPRVAGEWCKFCKAKSTCETFRSHSFAAMPFAFEDLVQPGIVPAHTAPLMAPEQVGIIWSKLGLLEEWAASFRSFVFNELASGRTIPGVALKRKRTIRKWMDETLVVEYLRDHGAGALGLAPPAPLSVARMEKAMKGAVGLLPEHLVVKEEGELTLCAADDPHALPLPSDTALRFPTYIEVP